MISTLLLVAAALLQGPSAPPAPPPAEPPVVPPLGTLPAASRFAAWQPPLAASSAIAAVADTQRPKAIEYSDLYYTRLTIHKYASYATLPLFVAEYFVGQSLYNNPGENESRKGLHGALAAGIGGLFAVNTVTGVWNLWDARHDPAGRTRRYVHGIAMLLADAGFVATAAAAPDDDRGSGSSRSRHKALAISSGSLALASYAMMLFWKD